MARLIHTRRRCNLLLQYAKRYPSPADIRTYVGEALFFRAYSYFDLLQLYGDVIIIDEPLAEGDARIKVAQNPRSEVVDFIVADLQLRCHKAPTSTRHHRAGTYQQRGGTGRPSHVSRYMRAHGRSSVAMRAVHTTCST